MTPCQEETAFEHSCKPRCSGAVPFSPSFTVFTCPNRVLSGDPALRNPTTGTAGQRPSHYRPHSCHTACRGSIPHPTQSLCTLRNHPACYQADATPYLDRSCTGSIAPALPGALTQSPWRRQQSRRDFEFAKLVARGHSVAGCQHGKLLEPAAEANSTKNHECACLQ